MDSPPSARVPIPTLATIHDRAKSRQFFESVQTHFHKEAKAKSDVEASEFSTHWIGFIEGLFNEFVDVFVSDCCKPWDNDEIKGLVFVFDGTLSLMSLFHAHVTSLYRGKIQTVKTMFTRLFTIAVSLTCSPPSGCGDDEDLPSPSLLANRTTEAAIGILRNLGGCIFVHNGEPSWAFLQTVFIDCLDIITELCSNARPYPLDVKFFDKARLLPTPSTSTEPAGDLTLVDDSARAAALSCAFDILVKTINPPFVSDWYIIKQKRQISESACQILNYCTSAKAPAALDVRLDLVARVALSCQSLPDSIVSEQLFGCFLRCLIKERLAHVAQDNLEVVDEMIYRVVDTLSNRHVHLTKQVAPVVLQSLQTSEQGKIDSFVTSTQFILLQHLLPQLDLHQAIAHTTTVESRLEAVDQCVEEHLAQSDNAITTVLPCTGQRSTRWREEIHAIVNQIIHPDELSWMDEDGPVPDDQFAYRVMTEVSTGLSKNFQSAVVGPNNIVDQLLSLFRVLREALVESVFQAFAPQLLTWLLAANKAEIGNSPARSLVYDALLYLLRHTSTLSYDDAVSLEPEVQRGAGDADRSIRLLSGRVLNEFIITMHKNEQKMFLHRNFHFLKQLFDSSKKPIKGTVLTTVGLIGRNHDPEIRDVAFHFLTTCLNQDNPVLRGISYSQLTSIAKYLGKPPSTALLPHARNIAPFLITRMCSQPVMFNEVLRLLNLSRASFLSTCLPRILPTVFARADRKCLDIIVSELKTEASVLFLSYTPFILANIFSLPSAIDTNRAVTFVLDLLVDAANGANITIDNVVRSCILALLTELLMETGDDDAERSRIAGVALDRVARSLVKKGKGSKRGQPIELEGLLEQYLLGLMTEISNALQDLDTSHPSRDKVRTLRSLRFLITRTGPTVHNIMAILQTAIAVPELAQDTLQIWQLFLNTVPTADLSTHFCPTCASFVSIWPQLCAESRTLARETLEHLLDQFDEGTIKELDTVELGSIPELQKVHLRLQSSRAHWTARKQVESIVHRCLDNNMTVALQSLRELKTQLLSETDGPFRPMLATDVFDPLVGKTISTLLTAATRESDSSGAIRSLVFECIGILGALDPDRCEIGYSDDTIINTTNFEDEEETVTFALHLINELLAGQFSSTSDISYQSRLAYAIQELLRFCGINSDILGSKPVATKILTRWDSLPKDVITKISPLISSRYTVADRAISEWEGAVYPNQMTYREWIQIWGQYLIQDVSGGFSATIFGVFGPVIRGRDATIAHHLLPHLVLNILIAGSDDSVQRARAEILFVLQDQINPKSRSSEDKKRLSAQAVFTVLDHVGKWVRAMRQEIGNKKPEGKSTKKPEEKSTKKPDGKRNTRTGEAQIQRVDSILASIDHILMAKAAFECKAYARSLINYERQMLVLMQKLSAHKEKFAELRKKRKADEPMKDEVDPALEAECSSCYDRLHEIYAKLDEPDGMEGISTFILNPSLEHQIRKHESTGQWTSAQSCWETKLQQDPDELEYQIGLIRCLQNLGHHETLQNHITGVLARNPNWRSELLDFKIESAWTVGAWHEVQQMVQTAAVESQPILTARVLLAMREGDDKAINDALTAARCVIGAPIVASGKGYRQSYNAALLLHSIHELELIRNNLSNIPGSVNAAQRRKAVSSLSRTLSIRLNLTLPNFRVRQFLVNLRRTAFSLKPTQYSAINEEIGCSWLASAKIARKAGQWQTAYSALLQAHHHKVAYAFLESAKLLKATGETSRAVHELDTRLIVIATPSGDSERTSPPTDINGNKIDPPTARMEAKGRLLQARWMNTSSQYDTTEVLDVFKKAHQLYPEWENSPYHVGKYQDDRFKEVDPSDRLSSRATKFNLNTVKYYTKAIKHGSKHVYLAIPRILTIWLDAGEDPEYRRLDVFHLINEALSQAIDTLPAYKWYTAFPQIVSRVGHNNQHVCPNLERLILIVLGRYPKQAMWLFASVEQSSRPERKARGQKILNKLLQASSHEIRHLIRDCRTMTNLLLKICNKAVHGVSPQLTIGEDFPEIQKLVQLSSFQLIIPLQESLTAALPSTPAPDSRHEPFPSDAPGFKSFGNIIEVMTSMARPRKITIIGTDGQVYRFLGKPKDDLRKDARLMDFNTIINKLLKADSEARRRQLYIRTYGVITLSEECGFIQWVPNTAAIRPIIYRLYEARKIPCWPNSTLTYLCKKIKDAKSDQDAGGIFQDRILKIFPPVFHEWFMETFPEPSAWFASRLCYARTTAVMSMVGFILGLGDRHLENILLDVNTAAAVHVDLNCLFERGKTLETPERVPFRLTHNMVDGLGLTGPEGVFRIACEMTMSLLRTNKDTLMSILDAFVHDPLVEWEDAKRKLEREAKLHGINIRGQDEGPDAPVHPNSNKFTGSINLRELAKKSLAPIEKKLTGVFIPWGKEGIIPERAASVSALVQALILESTNPNHLGRMYAGWAPWH